MEGANGFGAANASGEALIPRRDSLYIVIPITIIYVIIFLTGVVGNVVTCIVISKNRCMHTATNYYLCSLALSDLLLLVSGLPQEVYFIWFRYPYIFSEAFCVMRGMAAETSANATVLTITAFTVERYVAICKPFRSQTMSKLSRAVRWIMVIWLVAFGFAVPQALQFGLTSSPDPNRVMCAPTRVLMRYSFEVSTFLFFCLPMMVITVLYALIGLRLRRSSSGALSKPPVVQSNGPPSSVDARLSHQATTRVLKMLVAVVVAFFLCWAPFHAQRLVAIYGTTPDQKPFQPLMLKIYEIVTYGSGVLHYVSATLNPILYHIMSHKFREAFKETARRCCGFRSVPRRRGERYYTAIPRGLSRRNTASGMTVYGGQPVVSIAALPGASSSSACAGSLRGSMRTSSTCMSDHRRRTASESVSINISSASASSGNDAPTRGLITRRRTTDVIIKRRRCSRPPKVGWPTRVRLFLLSILGGAGRSLATGGAAVAVAVPVESGRCSVGRRAMDSISNSSLRDVEDNDLKTELAAYLDGVRWK